MKKLILLIIPALCIIASCSKDSGFGPGMDLSSGFNKGFPSPVPVIVYSPAADGDDTDELLDLLTNAEPGSVIKLGPGVYHLGYMEIVDFEGSIIGAGEDKTIIYPITPIPNKIQEDENLSPCWLRFIRGNICISQITFTTDVPEPIQEFNYEPFMGKDLFTMFVFTDYNDKYRTDGIYYQKVVINNVRFIGGTDDAGGIDPQWQTDHNTLLAVWCGFDVWWPKEGFVYPLTRGDFTITNCKFEHFLDAAEGFGLGVDATMRVSSCKVTNCFEPLYFTANHGSKIYIANNMFSGSTIGDILIEDVDWGILANTPINPRSRSRYNITGNIFNNSAPIPSLIMWDNLIAMTPELSAPMLMMVQGNTFNLTDGSTGIEAFNSQDAVIKNNRFRGECVTGIVVDGVQTDRFQTPLPLDVNANNVLLLGNNFTGLESANADIVLGEKSTNCTVVGSAKDDVIDNGTNNKVIGLKPVHRGYHMGPLIRDNFRSWHRR